ncbi:MAG: tRNA (N6-isopentenyl adenosine(37)-C2)-methylthiotransferase MiaB, partial [Clostridiaceae bacterium]|nr:tRNA (N6-isopentenyl adenosine(37)-C2)-methylthiotransferase MiaB [Clostridiaceae bacterium]
HIVTFGCQMNENDSEKIAGMLKEMGYEESDRLEESHIIVYNTCCVREHPESKVFGHIGALKSIKDKRRDVVICICGCMVQQEEIVKKIVEKHRHVDIILGTQNLHRFPEMLYSVLINRNVAVAVKDCGTSIVEGIPIKRKDKIRVWVTIMHGCNNFCSYCIVPYVRGRERSRRMEDIMDEIRALAGQGYKEVTLLGQNVNSYGKDLDGKPRFAELLYKVNEIKGLERIRFTTSHPKDLSIELIHAMRDCEKVCEHLHLPLQSGSSKVLKDMNRKYTKEQYLDLVSAVKENIPGVAITTDIIVGFPGETDEDFLDTLDVVKKVEFDMAYTFIYSKRKGTRAAERTDLVPGDIVKERFDSLVRIQNDISKQKNDSLLNRTLEILVEGLSRTSDKTYTGRTRTNKVVNFPGNENMVGSLVNVKIKKTLTWSLEGEVVQ